MNVEAVLVILGVVQTGLLCWALQLLEGSRSQADQIAALTERLKKSSGNLSAAEKEEQSK